MTAHVASKDFKTSLVNASDTCKQLLQQSKVMSQQQGADRADRQERQRIDNERYAKDSKQQQVMLSELWEHFTMFCHSLRQSLHLQFCYEVM